MAMGPSPRLYLTLPQSRVSGLLAKAGGSALVATLPTLVSLEDTGKKRQMARMRHKLLRHMITNCIVDVKLKLFILDDKCCDFTDYGNDAYI